MTHRYERPAQLAADHDLSGFESRSSEQSLWLRRHARQSHASRSTRVFVSTDVGEKEVVAYYAWRMAQLRTADAPRRMQIGAARYPQPVALLARLAVDQRHEGNGLGAALFADVIGRLLMIDPSIGCRGLLIHCESAEARDFYRHLVPELEASPTDPMHLVLLTKDAQATFDGEL